MKSSKEMTYDKAFLIDMDGVIIKGNSVISGAIEFIETLKKERYKFLFLTNNSYFTPEELQERFKEIGINVDYNCFYTSAMATASFLLYQMQQRPGFSAYIIGGKGLLKELQSAGIEITNSNPDYVIMGETEKYDYLTIREATHLIQEGARFLATNPDLSGPTQRGPAPACGALVSPIEKVTGISPYFIGKPNPAMMYWARKKLGVHSANCFMIGDRMDTDIVGGLESGMTTCLVLSGVTTRNMAKKFAYQPDYIFENIGEINPGTILPRRENA